MHTPDPSLVLAPAQFPDDPYLRVPVEADLGARHLVALDVTGRRFEILDRFPGSTPYLVRRYRQFDDVFGPEQTDRVELHALRARAIVVRVRIRLAPGQSGQAYTRVDAGRPELTASGEGTFTASFTLSAAQLISAPRESTVAFGVALGPSPDATARLHGGEAIECRFQARVVAGGDVEILEPCDGWHRYAFPGGATALVPEDVSAHVEIDATAA